MLGAVLQPDVEVERRFLLYLQEFSCKDVPSSRGSGEPHALPHCLMGRGNGVGEGIIGKLKERFDLLEIFVLPRGMVLPEGCLNFF